jgi:long-chain-fatty-acid--CoA ligase ACSBG
MGNAEVKMQAPSAESQIPYTVYDPADGEFCSSDGTAEAKIRFAAEGPASEDRLPAMTVPQAFKLAIEKRADKIALQVERPCPPLNGKIAPPALPIADWTKWTYAEYYAESAAIAKALIAIGCKQHDASNIFGFNSPEWFIAEIGTILAGGKAAGIYPTDTPEQIAFKAEHSGAAVAFLEDESKLAKFTEAAKALPDLKAVVCWGCAPGKITGPNGDIPCYSWEDFKKLGADVPDADLDARIAAQRPGHCCALIYTSGTTGQPKAVMITHDNILAEAALAANEMPNICKTATQERVLSYLPLSHVAGMLVDIVMPIYMTSSRPGWITCSFARQYDLKVGSVGDRLRAVKPTMFLGVPRVWEKIAEKLKAIGAQTKGIKKTLSTWAKKLSLEHQNNCQLGGDGYTPFGHSLANKLVLSKIKAALGLDECKFGFTGAAPITKATLEYFGQLGIQINEVYGMSENTGATTWSTDVCHVWGSCGYELPGTEVKIFRVSETDINDKTECPKAKDLKELSEDEKGEVCFRGRHIMLGYLANPKLGDEHVATINKKLSEAIDKEGWLHSGDQGAIDVRGMVKITGRYKELIIGAGGENIAPVPFEDRVKELCPAISNFLMIGDKRKFNVALVTLKCVGATGENPGTDVLDGAAAQVDPAVTTVAQAASNEAYIKMIQDAIVATNKDGKACPMNAAKVQKFTILPYDFSVEGGELTPTLKTKRSVVDKTFLEAIDGMYASKDTYVKHPQFAASSGGAAAADSTA